MSVRELCDAFFFCSFVVLNLQEENYGVVYFATIHLHKVNEKKSQRTNERGAPNTLNNENELTFTAIITTESRIALTMAQ